MKKTKEQPTYKEMFEESTELLMKSLLRELQMRIDMKRQNLISYILGIFVGMAIGSMIVNYLAR